MNKKVLSAILFSALFAGTGTFTSCIDNDEPAGIEELRGAKAQLIVAKAEVEKANASYVLAAAEYQKALAATEQANAQYRLAETKWMEAKAEYEAAVAEEKKAWAEKQMADYQNQMTLAAENLKTQLAQAKMWAAQAEFAYNTAMKQIAIAEALGFSNATSLEWLKGEIENRYNAIYVTEYENGKTLVEAIREAEEKLYDAMMDKATGVDSEDASAELWIPTLELAVAEQEANVAAEKEALAKLENFLEKDVETTDWRAEVEALKDSAEALKLAISEKEIEIDKALNSEEILAAKQKIEGVNAGGGVVEKGTQTLLNEAIAEHNKYARDYAQDGTNNKDLKVSAINVPVNAELVASVRSAIGAYNALPTTQTQTLPLGLNPAGDAAFYVTETEYNHPDYAKTEAKTAEDDLLAQVNATIAALDKAVINQENIEWAELTKEQKEKAVEDAQKVYDNALLMWEIAKSAVNGTATAIPAEEIAKVTTAIANYNAAITTLGDKITAYNTTIDNVYKAAYDAAVASEYNGYYWNGYATDNLKGFKELAETDLADTTLFPAGTEEKVEALLTLNTTANGINYTALFAAVEALYVTNVVDNAATTTVNEKTEAEKEVADLLAASKKAAAKAAGQAELDNDGWETAAKTAGSNAVDTDADDAIADALEEITNAEKALDGTTTPAVKGKLTLMTEAWTAFKNLAQYTYAQGQTTAAAAALTLPTAKPTAGWTKSATAAADQALGKKAINVAKVDETKVAAMMTLELKPTWANAALLSTTNKAFGLGNATTTDQRGRLTMPTADEMLADKSYTINGDNPATTDVVETSYVANGAWYALYDAKAELQSLNDQLAQTENLAALKAAVAEAKTTLVAEIAANDKLFDKYHAAIVAANKANEEAKAELAAIEDELIGGMRIEQAKLKAKLKATENVARELTYEINNHLHLDGTFINFNGAASFEEALEDAVLEAKQDVADAEQELAEAKVALQKAQDGKYDAVANAQFELDQLNAELERRQAKYDEALANLEKAMEILVDAE